MNSLQEGGGVVEAAQEALDLWHVLGGHRPEYGLDCLTYGLDCLMYGLDCLICGQDVTLTVLYIWP